MEDNQAQTMDNLATEVSSEVSNEPGSLLSSVQAESVEQVATETTGEYGYVPEKFMKDGVPDFEKLSKSYSELEKKLGTKAPALSVEDYEYEFSEPDKWDSTGFELFKGQALEQGLTKDQFNMVMGLYEKNVSQMVDSFRQTPEKAEAELKQEWGKEYDNNLKSAIKAVQTFAPEGFDVDSIGNDPKVIKLLAAIGSQLNEDVPLNQGVSVGSTMSRLEIDELMRSSDYYTNQEKQKIVANYYNANYK